MANDHAKQLIEVLHSMTKTKAPVKAAPKATVRRKPKPKRAKAAPHTLTQDGSGHGGYYTSTPFPG